MLQEYRFRKICINVRVTKSSLLLVEMRTISCTCCSSLLICKSRRPDIYNTISHNHKERAKLSLDMSTRDCLHTVTRDVSVN
jgi:hypothetical protein